MKDTEIEILIKDLEKDLPKLRTDESYFYHEPMYFNYVTYYELLSAKLAELDGNNESFFGTYLVSFISYQLIDLGKELAEVVEEVISLLEEKLVELRTNNPEPPTKDMDA